MYCIQQWQKNTGEHSLRQKYFTQGKSIVGKAKYVKFIKFEFLLVAKFHYVILRVSALRVEVTMESYVHLKVWKRATETFKTSV